MSQLLKVTFEYLKQPIDDYHYMLRDNKMLYTQAGSIMSQFSSKIQSLVSSPPRPVSSVNNVNHPAICKGLKVIQHENDILRAMLKRVATAFDGIAGRFKESHDVLKNQGNEWKELENSFGEAMEIIQKHYDQGQEETTNAKQIYESAKRKLDQAQEKRRLASLNPEQHKVAQQIEDGFEQDLQEARKVYNMMAEKHKVVNQLITDEVQALAQRIGKSFIESSIMSIKLLQSSLDTLSDLMTGVASTYPKDLLDTTLKSLKSTSNKLEANNTYFACPEMPTIYQVADTVKHPPPSPSIQPASPAPSSFSMQSGLSSNTPYSQVSSKDFQIASQSLMNKSQISTIKRSNSSHGPRAIEYQRYEDHKISKAICLPPKKPTPNPKTAMNPTPKPPDTKGTLSSLPPRPTPGKSKQFENLALVPVKMPARGCIEDTDEDLIN